MDGMLSLFETVIHSNCDDVLLHTFLRACTEQQAFLNKIPTAIQSIVASINSKLNSPVTRYEGLLLLKTFLPQCSAEIFGENVISWMQHCLKSRGVGHDKHALANASYEVLKILLQMSEKMPEMKRSVSGLVVKIIDNFQQIVSEEASLSMLECIEVLMFIYGPSCRQQKNVLEKCVLQYVDSNDINVIKRVAHCMAFLPLIGGGGSQGANHVTQWKQEQQKLCATLHYILDELFDGIREIPNVCTSLPSGQMLSLPVISLTVPLLRVHQLVTRFINVSKFLQAMLISEFPVEKTVLPSEIFGIVCRGLAVTSHMFGNKMPADILMVGAMLPQIQVALLKILESLIICCGRNLLPYAPVICKLVLQTLKWTSTEKWAYGIEKPFGQLREAACNTLTLWLQTANCGSCVELISEQLVSVLMQDVWFGKEAVTLNVQNTSRKKKQKCKQNASEQNKQQQGVENAKKHIPDQKANSNTCRAALRVLQWMLHSAASFIKPTIHRLIQETVVGLLFDVQRSSNAQDLPVPYGETSCRLELYRLLHKLVLEPHATWPPPTQFALQLLSTGRSDPSLEVSSLCTAALIAVEKLVHPASGTLHFPVSLEEMLESTRIYQQEYPTKDKESINSMEISEGEEEENAVHKRGGLSSLRGGLAQAKSNMTEKTNHATSSSDELVIVYENKIEIDEAESEDEVLSESEVVSVHSEESENIVVNEVSQSHGLSKMLSKSNDEQEISVVDIAESDGEFQHKEAGSASSAGVGDNIEIKTQPIPLALCNKDPSSIISTHSIKEVDISGDLGNEDENLILYQQQKETTKSIADSIGRCKNIIQASTEKGSIDIVGDTSNDMQCVLITENEEQNDNDKEDDDIEPTPKKIKLDLPESVEVYAETSKADSISKVKDSTVVSISGDEKEEKRVNGLDPGPKEVTEEEMLQAFVDVVTE